jgi:hypothetical protein
MDAITWPFLSLAPSAFFSSSVNSTTDLSMTGGGNVSPWIKVGSLISSSAASKSFIAPLAQTAFGWVMTDSAHIFVACNSASPSEQLNMLGSDCWDGVVDSFVDTVWRTLSMSIIAWAVVEASLSGRGQRVGSQ